MFRNRRWAPLIALFLSFAMFAAACGDDDDSTADGDAPTDAGDGSALTTDGTVNISGSSTVRPISERAKELYDDAAGSNTNITVDGPGTSDGFELFCQGDTDINDASRSIKESEIEACAANGVEFIELLVAFDGIAVMVNPDNPLECVNFADLYGIMGPESEGFDWSEAQSLAAELGSSTDGWPDGDIVISAPGTESGTYGSFIEIVLEGIADERADAGEAELATDSEGDPFYIRTDYSGLAFDDDIITGIAGESDAFGWVGFAFAEAAGDAVKVLQVAAEDGGECVSPSIETIADDTYPVSRPLFIYVNAEKLDSNPLLADYVDFYLTDGYEEAVSQAFGEAGGYVVLPDATLADTQARLEARTTGAA